MVRPAHYFLPEVVQEAFRDGAERFYAALDWALDITGAKFSDAEFSGIPGRPPDSVPPPPRPGRDGGLPGLVPCARSYLAKARTYPYPTVVVVAPTRSKYFKDVLKDLESLRAAGIAE